VRPDTTLSKDDCEVARTAEELIAWIKSVEDQFHTDDRIEERLIKAFFEEVRPLGDLARHRYLGRPGLYFHPKIGDQDYDAEIIDRSSGDEKIARVEFTSAYRDSDLALRLESLARHGDVYMTGYVGRNGTRASGGQVYVVPGFEDHQVILNKMLDNITARVADKLDKHYAANTMLAVVVDDSILNLESDVPLLSPRFMDIMLSLKVLGKFRGLFIIGASGRTFWEFGETWPS
jgi:hypothetical protein